MAKPAQIPCQPQIPASSRDPAAEHPRFGEEKLNLGLGSSRKGGKMRIKFSPSLPECPGSASHLGNSFLGVSSLVLGGLLEWDVLLQPRGIIPSLLPIPKPNPAEFRARFFQLWNKTCCAPAAPWSLWLDPIPKNQFLGISCPNIETKGLGRSS